MKKILTVLSVMLLGSAMAADAMTEDASVPTANALVRTKPLRLGKCEDQHFYFNLWKGTNGVDCASCINELCRSDAVKVLTLCVSPECAPQNIASFFHTLRLQGSKVKKVRLEGISRDRRLVISQEWIKPLFGLQSLESLELIDAEIENSEALFEFIQMKGLTGLFLENVKISADAAPAFWSKLSDSCITNLYYSDFSGNAEALTQLANNLPRNLTDANLFFNLNSQELLDSSTAKILSMYNSVLSKCSMIRSFHIQCEIPHHDKLKRVLSNPILSHGFCQLLLCRTLRSSNAACYETVMSKIRTGCNVNDTDINQILALDVTGYLRGLIDEVWQCSSLISKEDMRRMVLQAAITPFLKKFAFNRVSVVASTILQIDNPVERIEKAIDCLGHEISSIDTRPLVALIAGLEKFKMSTFKMIEWDSDVKKRVERDFAEALSAYMAQLAEEIAVVEANYVKCVKFCDEKAKGPARVRIYPSSSAGKELCISCLRECFGIDLQEAKTLCGYGFLELGNLFEDALIKLQKASGMPIAEIQKLQKQINGLLKEEANILQSQIQRRVDKRISRLDELIKACEEKNRFIAKVENDILEPLIIRS